MKKLPDYLVKEWHPTKNGNITPDMVSYGSNKLVWWLGGCGHEWSARINKRSLGHGCPYCSGQKVLAGFNDLASRNPEILTEWDYEKNELEPNEVNCHTNKKYWWICKNSHSWLAAVYNRLKGDGCPYCSNRKVLAGYNDLETTNPELAKEWDYEKNDFLPKDVVPGTRKKAWWVCKKCGHSWKSIIYTRAQNGCGCPCCARKDK